MSGEVARRGMAATTHVLKSRPYLFQPMVDGNKVHDMRRADRDFAVGDRVILREHEHVTDTYTGRKLNGRITYVTSETNPCALSTEAMGEGYVVLSIRIRRTSLLWSRLAGVRANRRGVRHERMVR